MKKLVGLCLLLSACSHTATEQLVESAQQTLKQLESNLPVECKSNATNSLIAATDTQIKAILTTCNTEKSKIKSERNCWIIAFFGLLICLGAYVFGKLRK